MKYFRATLKTMLNPLTTQPTGPGPDRGRGRQAQAGMKERENLRKSYRAEDLNF